MKKAIGIAVLVAILMCGCGKGGGEKVDGLGDRFETIEYGGGWWIIVDNQTNVLYLYDTTPHQGGLTVLLKPDGTPMLRNEVSDPIREESNHGMDQR